MRKKGGWIKRWAYENLSLESYLRLLSRMYFLSFDLGLLKKDRVIAYPYFLKKIIKPGDEIIDIGANLGYLAMVFSKATGSDGTVHCVEPVEPVRNVLKKNLRGRKNLKLYPYALGTENKRIKLGNDSRLQKGYVASGSHFVLDADVTGKEEADVEWEAEMKRGSELFAELPKIDFIKCDIEGYEVVVLKEMESLIDQHKPIVLLETRGEERAEMISFFESKGFKSFILEDEKLLPGKVDQFWDLFFVHPSRMDRLQPYIF
jgi:FkbM family methyltransferase